MKSLLSVVTAMVAGAALAGSGNVVISFSSTGPDTYRDGTQVLDGESYALVWTPTGSEFGGINADGSAVAPSKVAIKAPIAKNGACPKVMFQIDEDYAAANYPGGTWGVYLLDTRVFAVDAEGVVQKDAEGKSVVASVGGAAVKGYGEVAAALGKSFASAEVKAPVAAGALSAADVKIRDIQLKGDNVFLYVTGASAGQFELSAGTQANELKAEGKDRAAQAGDDEAIIVRPRAASGEFFSVNRK